MSVHPKCTSFRLQRFLSCQLSPLTFQNKKCEKKPAFPPAAPRQRWSKPCHVAQVLGSTCPQRWRWTTERVGELLGVYLFKYLQRTGVKESHQISIHSSRFVQYFKGSHSSSRMGDEDSRTSTTWSSSHCSTSLMAKAPSLLAMGTIPHHCGFPEGKKATALDGRSR